MHNFSMPLMCQSPTGPEYSYRHDLRSWARLRSQNATCRHLYMPCCQSSVVLKRSVHGTLFFAHARRNGCRTAPESLLHLLVKDVIARTAEHLGYSARTECAGQSPDGDDWVADVLCRGSHLHMPIAFEVQLSRQTIEITLSRSALHRRSGVTTFWLMRQPDLPVSESTPAFMLTVDPGAGSVMVLLPSRFYRQSHGARTSVNSSRQWGQSVSLQQFVRCALTGRLRFAPVLGTLLPLNLLAADVRCWQCGRTTRIVTGLEFEADPMFPGFGNHTLDLEPLGVASPEAEAWVTRELPTDVLASVEIGPIRRRVDRVRSREYLSNGCIHCDALQYEFYTAPDRGASRRVLRTYAMFESWIATACPHWVNRWWLPDS